MAGITLRLLTVSFVDGSTVKYIRALPKEASLDPYYTHYTSDLPTSQKTVTSTFADDTGIVAKDSDPTTASRNLQDHLTSIEKWLHKWRIKVNQNKSTHITFTNRKGQCSSISTNQTTIPQGSTVKYLGLAPRQQINNGGNISPKKGNNLISKQWR
jgi:hypothetical protein